ncbi:carboxypeptidase regulatory-like domain-containing protein, partial [Nocardioides sp.]|uniref:carboxypeptidase regulatory-like domain-containing protein n=1 Tax=Nocardioides sp. TaxID=35761 RepID=UPI00286DFF06
MTPEFNLDKTDVELADDVAATLNGTATVNATLASNQRTVSGTVTAASGGAAVSGVTVRVERRVQTQDDVRWRLVDSPATIANGTWSTTVPDGTYRVGFRKVGFLEQWYDAATVLADADPVVVNGVNRTGINAALQVGGTISGTVTGPAGPLTNGFVTFWRELAPGNLDVEDEVALSGTGTYTSPPLTPGTYVVQFGASGHVSEYFNNAPDASTAQRIVVGVGTTFTANGTLAKALKLSGTVTGPTGTPLAGVDVLVEKRFDFGGGDVFWDYVVQPTTDAAGAWSVDLGAGTYRVSFFKSGYATEWFDNAATSATAQSIVVTSADVGAINAQLAPAAVLNGTVSGPDGPVFGDVTVYAADATDLATATPLAEDFTGSDGQYLIERLPAGSYKIRFEASRLLPEFHLDKTDLASATSVAISTAAPTTVDATLARGKAIAGTVTGVGGAIEDGSVDFYRQLSDGSYSYVDSDNTDADGAYRAFLPSGTYKLRFSGYDNRVSEWWNNASSQAAATSVTLTSADVPGIDAVLDDGATVTGTVTFAQRRSGWDSNVQVYDAVSGAFAGSAAVNAHTNAFSISNLPPGTYRAQFARTATYELAEAQFFNAKSENLGLASSETFVLGAAATRAAVNAVLVEGGRLTGVIQDAAGLPLADCIVTAYTNDGSLVSRTSRSSAADGSFAVPGLTTGSYFLRTSNGGCGSTTMYYDGVGSMSTVAGNATGVNATRGVSTAVPQTLVIGGLDPVVNTALPTVSDTTPVVGQLLTSTPGSWNPSDSTYAYQWLANGGPIAGATGSSYTVVAGDIGKTLAVRVTATRDGFASSTATSAATSAVAPQPVVTNTAVPTVSDTTPEVGQVLTAGDGTWSPADVTLAYEWRSDGTPIAGATSKTFQVPAGQLGKKLSVRVTASKVDHVPATATSTETAAVVAAT